MTSDGGVVLLSEVDRKIGLMQAASRCITDPRSPLLIRHGVRDMLRQRVYVLFSGELATLRPAIAICCDPERGSPTVWSVNQALAGLKR